MSDSIFKPLGLNHSATVRPIDDNVGVIPMGDSGWFRAIGNETA